MYSRSTRIKRSRNKYSGSPSKKSSKSRSRKNRSNSRSRSRSKSSRNSVSANKDFIWSENRNYLFDTHDNKLLYIEQSLPVPSFLSILNKIKIPKSYIEYDSDKIYNVCQFFGKKFKNDCLMFAECMTTGNFTYREDDSFLKEKTTGETFGNSDKENIQIAKKVSKDYYYDFYSVNPDIGESYAIISHDIKDKKMPYHIAYVLAKDGISNITIEADSGDKLKLPKFGIYDVKFPETLSTRRSVKTSHKNIVNNTFHDWYKGYFKKSTTLVLVPK